MTVVVRKPRKPATVFNRFLGADLPLRQLSNRPAVNIVEFPEHFRIELAVPGLDKEDFKLNVEKEVLTISAVKEVEDQEGITYRRREFGAIDFERNYQLPETIDSDNIEATYVNGILAIVLPKKEEAKEKPARQISVG